MTYDEEQEAVARALDAQFEGWFIKWFRWKSCFSALSTYHDIGGWIDSSTAQGLVNLIMEWEERFRHPPQPRRSHPPPLLLAY